MDCKFPQSLLKLMSIESMMPSNHLILCHPLLLLPSIFPSIRVFSSESALCIRWPKYWNFSSSIHPSTEHSELIGLISYARDLQQSSPAPQIESSSSWCLAFFMVQLSHPYMTTGKTIALTIQTFVGKVMSLLCNMQSRFVRAFLPRNKHLLISWLQSPPVLILEPKKIKSVTVSIFFPSIGHEVMEPNAIIFIFWMLSFNWAFSLSSFTFIQSFFSSFALSATRMLSLASLRLLIILPAILIQACASSSLAHCMMYSTCKLNKQGDNMQPWCSLFPILNQSIVPCPVLIVVSWSAHRFHWRQVRWSGILISLRIFHHLLWSTVKGFSIVIEAESRCLSGIPLLFLWSNRCWHFWSLVPLPFLNPAWTSGSSQFMYCWSLAWRILGITRLACEMSSIVW